MALDKLVDSTQLDTDLTAVANAIRTKGGTSAALAFPQGFLDAVEAIETGGGGYSLEEWLSGAVPTGTVTVNNGDLKVGAFSGCTSHFNVIYIPSGTLNAVSAFSSATGANIFCAPNITHTGNLNLRYGYLKRFIAQKATTIGVQCMRDMTGLVAVDVAAQEIGYMSLNKLSGVLILRGDSVCTLANTNSLGATANNVVVYVKSVLKSQYAQATNWSILLSNGYISFADLEGSEYEDPDWWEAYL